MYVVSRVSDSFRVGARSDSAVQYYYAEKDYERAAESWALSDASINAVLYRLFQILPRYVSSRDLGCHAPAHPGSRIQHTGRSEVYQKVSEKGAL